MSPIIATLIYGFLFSAAVLCFVMMAIFIFEERRD